MARHLFIVSRAHRDLYEYLAKQFQDDRNVRVILDRRLGDRRQAPGRAPAVTDERRLGDRRSRPSVDEDLRSRSHAIVTLSD